MKIKITEEFKKQYDCVELRLYSERNSPVCRDSDVREEDPNKDFKLFARAFDGMYNMDYLFPVVDIRMDDDMDGVLLFSHVVGGWYKVNPMFYPEKHQINTVNIIPAKQLEEWENWIYFAEPNCCCEGFYIRKQITETNERLDYEFDTLSNGWSGYVEIVGVVNDEEEIINKQKVTLDAAIKMNEVKKDDLSEENLLTALNNSLQYLLDSMDQNPRSPMYRGLNLFYDYDAKTYRQKYWLWTYAPAIQTFIRAADLPACQKLFGSVQLLGAAKDLGDLAVKYQELDIEKPYCGMTLCRYDYSIFHLEGYDSKYSPADGLMLAGIGMIPLYDKTGDINYFNFCKQMVEATGELLKMDTVIQQDYYPVMEAWKTNTVNEAGFGMEGIAELYRMTGDAEYLKIGKKYIDQLIDYLENEDGLWDKNFFRHSGRIDRNDFLTRGMAWAMMGITSAYRMSGEETYLQKSKKMAQSLMNHQLSDGSWSFYYNQGTERYGVSEKGTAAWCYLFYRMYHMTQEKQYLDTARKALGWLINNQDSGSDVQGHGGIAARTPQSGVVSRAFFKLSCSYTVGFFALALLDELDRLKSLQRTDG